MPSDTSPNSQRPSEERRGNDRWDHRFVNLYPYSSSECAYPGTLLLVKNMAERNCRKTRVQNTTERSRALRQKSVTGARSPSSLVPQSMNGISDAAAAAAAVVPMAIDDKAADDMQVELTVGTVPAVEVLQPVSANGGEPHSPCARRVCPDRPRERHLCMA